MYIYTRYTYSCSLISFVFHSNATLYLAIMSQKIAYKTSSIGKWHQWWFTLLDFSNTPATSISEIMGWFKHKLTRLLWKDNKESIMIVFCLWTTMIENWQGAAIVPRESDCYSSPGVTGQFKLYIQGVPQEVWLFWETIKNIVKEQLLKTLHHIGLLGVEFMHTKFQVPINF